MSIEDQGQTFASGMVENAAEYDDGKKDPQAKAQEYAEVKKWMAKLKYARKFDEEARKQYALDRRYARADRGLFTVDVPIAQSYIDVLRSFLFAKDPSVSVTPSGMTEPPPQKDIEALVLKQMGQQQPAAPAPMPGMMPAGGPPGMMGSAQGQPPSDPGMVKSLIAKLMPQFAGPAASKIPPQAIDAAMAATQPQPPAPPPTPEEQQAQLQAKVQELLAPYQAKRDNAKQLAATMQLVIQNLWKKAFLKQRAKMVVGSALTCGPGWIKAYWLERMGEDPTTVQQIQDIHEQLARIASSQRELDEGEAADPDEAKESLRLQLEGLQAKVQVVVARGFAIDFVAAEDVQVSTDVPCLSQYNDAQWIAHRTFSTVEQLKADYPDIEDKLASAAAYHPKAPKNTAEQDIGSMAKGDVKPEEADSYGKGSDSGESTSEGCESYGCVWEVWDRNTGMVLTLIEGVDCYAKKPHPADVPTTRGHPLFLYSIGNIDGQRHPRSMVTRSERLFDEYNATRSAYRTHRQRSLPKTAYNRTNYDATEIARLEAGDTGEMVGIKPINPGIDIRNCLVPITYPQIDMALYDTQPIRTELEMIWGIQEALSSSIHVAKTATEAEMQQQGTQSRTSYMQDDLDWFFNDLAQYTGEVAIEKLDEEDVQQIAGPWSVWPQGMSIDDLHSLCVISIHAGSSGKPDTTAQKQAWSTMLPILQNAITSIGQLRGSEPTEVADCQEALLQETASRMSDTVDINRFLPDPPRNPPPKPAGPPPQPMDQSALSGPQTLALLTILADVKGRVLSPASARGVIMAGYPHLPPDVVDQMVQGAVPMPGDPATHLDAPHAVTVPLAPSGQETPVTQPAAPTASTGATA